MNNNEYNSNNNVSSSGPYKASGNLNTVISNPSANINDTMGVNIQNASSSIQNTNQNINAMPSNQVVNQNINPQALNQMNTSSRQNVNVNSPETAKTTSVTKTYVTSDNKPKKRTISLNIGPEFKIAILIIVILLIFIFLLPLFPELF